MWVSITGSAERKEVREAEAEGVGRCHGCGMAGRAAQGHGLAALHPLGKYIRRTHRTP